MSRTEKESAMRKYAALMILAGLLGFLFLSGNTESRMASNAAEVLNAHQIAERNKPGTVMIYTSWKAHMVVPEPDVPMSKIPILLKRIRDDVKQGRVPNNEQAIKEAIVREVLINYLDYVEPGKTLIEKDVETGAMGTGFIITPDGYILTNAHVVYADDDYLKWELTQTALKELLEKDVQDAIKEAGEMDVEIPEDVMKAGTQNAALYYQRFMQLSRVSTEIFTEMGVAIPGLQAMQRGFASDLRKRGEPIPGKDVAILKIDKTNLPTVRLGDDATVTTGDRIYVIGYPAVATFHEMLSKESIIEAFLTSGLISARKTMQAGWTALQTDAAITHGNSGGPAFNEQGEVIGIATFGSIDYQRGGAEVQGMNFLVPIGVARQFLTEINVKPQESQLSKLYEQGLAYYDKHQYKYALEKFREVNELNPGYPYVTKYISDSRTAISEGRDTTWSPWIYAGIAVAGGFLLLIVIGVIVFVLYRRRPPHVGPTEPMHPAHV
jgi:S1-C subfamily serine protease